MTTRLLLLAAAIGATACPSMLSAQGVDLQNFVDVAKGTQPFALREPPHRLSPVVQPADKTAKLAREFTSMAEDMPPAFAEPGTSSQTIPVPRWMGSTDGAQKHDWAGFAPNWGPSISLVPCRAEPYAPSPQLPAQAERRRATWYFTMVDAACEAGVPVRLFDALIIQESRYNPAATSPKGAAGLAQLMPASARGLGVRNVWDPVENMRGGARYIRSLLDEFGRFDLALAAYNAGAGRVRATRRVPRISETIHYVSGILVTMQRQLAQTMASRE